MRKMLISLTTVGLLAVPAGMAMAQTDTPDPVGPVPTCVDPQQDRDRDRDRTVDQTAPEAQDQLRIQQRTQAQLHDGTGDGAGPGDGDGEMYRHQREFQHETRNG